ncbi:hypothetical protein MMC13_005421 [Lambiella insularis]|nr:hypothetical protein [Lambiella insularis]
MATLSSGSGEDDLNDQEQRLLSTLGQGTSQPIIELVVGLLASAVPHPDFIKYDQIQFVYEKLSGADVDEAVKMVVNDWTQNQENIQRAVRASGRSAPNTTADIVKAFCAFRFKPLKVR